MLIVLEDYFTWGVFLETVISCAIGIVMMATAVSAYFLAPMPGPFRILMVIAAIFMVAPSFTSDMYALVLALPVLVQQVAARKCQDQALTENA
jgi:TRAP-type uncharacterized transport system fused permease subunit